MSIKINENVDSNNESNKESGSTSDSNNNSEGKCYFIDIFSVLHSIILIQGVGNYKT